MLRGAERWRRGRGIAVTALLLLGSHVASAQDEMFAGAWHIVDAKPAPWAASDPALLQEFERLRGATVSFLPDQVEGPQPLGCTGAEYATGAVPPEGLFQGSLAEGQAMEQAAALGLPGENIATLDVTCDTGLFSYHLRDADTVLFALNNVVYSMSRQPPAEDTGTSQ